MIPGKNDPRWKEVVSGSKEYNISGLATKMLLMRVRTLVKTSSSPEKVNEAIDIAHDFFTKNEEMAKSDLEIILGK